MMERRLSKHAARLRGLVSDRELFGYLQRDTLNIIALSVLALSWMGAFVFYDPVDRRILTTWLPAVWVVWLFSDACPKSASFPLGRRRLRHVPSYR
jgi:hypothetical protein